MDARGADIKVDANHLLTMVILDTMLDMASVIFVTMILSSI